jgi:hypothetical protein
MANIKKQSKRRYHIVYQTTNTANNMIYIGAHSTDLLEDGYLGSGHRLTLAVEKYGVQSFERIVLHKFTTPEEMFKKEAELVNIEFLKRSDVYNIVEGGFGGYNKGTTGLKHLYHPESKKRCAVHPNTIPNMLIEGWVIGRNMSSTTNTIWIHKGEDKKMVAPDDLLNYVNNGWQRGLPKSPTQGKVWIHNPESGEYSLCETNELLMKISNGWIKKKWAPIKKGAAWVNNGVDNLRIPKEEIDVYTSKGWKKGMITSRWS